MENISDFTFCSEFVKRLFQLSPERNNRTSIALFNIVIDKKMVDLNYMWSNNDLESLDKYGVDCLGNFVYSFVRDNQELFINV